MSLVKVAEGSQGCAMAAMLGNLLEANVERSRTKRAIFRALRAVVGIYVEDIDVSLTLEFLGGRVVLHDGIVRSPQITVRTDSGSVMDLSSVSIRFGLPYLFDETGRNILQNLKSGRIRMFAMPWNLLDVIRLTRVMSAHD